MSAQYVTLAPVIYLDAGLVREVVRAGVIITLDDTQAAALAGSVSYVSPSTSFVDQPRVTTLSYDTYALFPVQGNQQSIYLDRLTGNIYEWSDISGYVLASTISPIALGFVQAAKNPDLLVTGAITVDGSDLITSAVVAWPDGKPGTLTITARDSGGAVLAYNITYGSPVTKTYTQPTITRNANGAATNVPAIVVT